MNRNDYAKKYLHFEISFKEYEMLCRENVRYMSLDNPVTVYSDDVKNAIQRFLYGKATKEELVDWINVVWFSDSYEFDEEHANSIISVVDQLECLDEENVSFGNEQYKQMIDALDSNTDFPCIFT